MYQWMVFVHIVGVLGFLAAHGVSIAVLFRLRTERDPVKVNDLMALSVASIRAFYISFAILLAGGITAAFLGHLWNQTWIWGAIGILVVVTLAMYAIVSPYYKRIRFISRAIAGGSEAVTREQFDGVLGSGRPMTVGIIGFVGLLAIVYLMVLKPTLGQSAAAAGSKLPKTTIQITAKNVAFDTSSLTAPASTAFTIGFDNEDGGTAHNVAIYTDRSAGTVLFRGDLVTGPKAVVYHVPALQAGSYFFRCDVHPTSMTGTLTVP
jgi:plastocyanin